VLIGLHNEMHYTMAEAILRLPRYWKAEKIARERAMEYLSLFHLEGHADELAGSLPYGAQRRLEIVRALATEPKLLLLDEPGANLDPANRHRIFALLHQLNQELTILLVSHNLNVVSSYVSHVICVNRMADMHAIGEIHVNALADGDWLSIEHIQCPVTTPPQECDHTL
jgi:branched-chain amino acid transport system ATP-binding protein